MELAKREGVTLTVSTTRKVCTARAIVMRAAFSRSWAIRFRKINKDPEGRVSIDWGVTGVPETFVIDGNGVIRVHYAGPLNDEVLRRLILPP
jgi:hypothetical protein